MVEISVIVPCYNGASVLPRCLDSLVNQTAFDSMEVIVVNDGSTDATQHIAEEYSAKYPAIRVISKPNEGLPQARRTGVAQARGRLIGFVDADDWIEPQMYEQMHGRLEQSGADVVCCGISQDTPAGDCRLCTGILPQDTVLTAEQALAWLQRRQDIYPYMWNKLYKAVLFEGVDYPTGTFVGEDYVINVQVLAKIKGLVFCPAARYHYVLAAGSVSRSGYSENYITAYKYYSENLVRLEEKFPADAQLFRNYVLTEYLAFLTAMARNKTYNPEMERAIQRFAHKNLWGYLAADYVENKFKLSIFVLSIGRGLCRGALRCAVCLKLV